MWFGDGDTAEPNRDLELLSADERARCARYSYRLDRSRFAAARAGARRVLARYVGGEPAQVRFDRAEADVLGDPADRGDHRHRPLVVAVRGTPLYLSVARSEGLWLLGLAVDERIGVDVEHVRDFDTAGLINRCLATEEREQVNALAPEERGAAFVRAWTRKEALIKAAGLPRSTPHHRIPVQPTRPGAVRVAQPDHSGRQSGSWTVQDLPLGGLVRASLARPAACAGPVRWTDTTTTGEPRLDTWRAQLPDLQVG